MLKWHVWDTDGRPEQNRCLCLMHFHLFSFFSPQAEVTSPTDSEDRTPGRLQAVWPPPKPKDEEEKVGLKYTEAGKKHRPMRSHVIFVYFFIPFLLFSVSY